MGAELVRLEGGIAVTVMGPVPFSRTQTVGAQPRCSHSYRPSEEGKKCIKNSRAHTMSRRKNNTARATAQPYLSSFGLETR